MTSVGGFLHVLLVAAISRFKAVTRTMISPDEEASQERGSPWTDLPLWLNERRHSIQLSRDSLKWQTEQKTGSMRRRNGSFVFQTS